MKLFDTVRDFFAPQEEDSFESEPVREMRDSRDRREVRESFRESMREQEESSAREIRQPVSLRERPESDFAPSKRDNKVVNIQATAQLLQENGCPQSRDRIR